VSEAPPLVAHIIHRLDVGGMENGLINLINHMPAAAYRHAILCMTDYTPFSRRIRREGVGLYSLGKREGKDLGVHLRLGRLLWRLRPAIVHTRNLATLEAQLTAALAGVPARVHGEHGWDVGDLDGSRPRSRRLRRLASPLVGQYIALSRQQMHYLRERIGVPEDRLNHVCNGVDTDRFSPAPEAVRAPLPEGFAPPGSVVIGTVLRMQPVKAPADLVHAFLALRERLPERFAQLRLVVIGDGPLRAPVVEMLAAAGVASQAWLPGRRDDIPELMRALDLFILPSLAEGICNTILEAMASGLPVIATSVGGNPDLIRPGESGSLVPPGASGTLAAALAEYVVDAERRRWEGAAARARIEAHFSMAAMVRGYLRVYGAVTGRL